MKALLIAAAMFATSAHADFIDGNELYQRMNGSHSKQMTIYGYLTGVFDSTYKIYHCSPENITAGQLFDMAKMTLENEPENRANSGAVIVVTMLAKRFPCLRS